MKWGITGAGGQLGIELSKLLHAFGYETQSWRRKDLNVSDEHSVETIVSSKPDVIVNCAAWTDVDGAETNQNRAFEVNQHGARVIAMAARKLEIPLVHISTDYVFSGIGSHPWRVNDQTDPATVYGRSKLAGEQEILNIYPDQSYILRTAWLYGQFGENFPCTIIEKLLEGKEVLRVVDDQFGQPTSTKDLSNRIIELLQNRLPFGIYHATNSGETSWFEFSQYLLGLMKQSSNRVVPVKTNDYPRPAPRPQYSVLDHSKWIDTSLPPMRNWKIAIDETYPDILETVKERIHYG